MPCEVQRMGDTTLPCSDLPFVFEALAPFHSVFCSQKSTGDNMPLVTDIVFHLSSLDLQIWIRPLPKVLKEHEEEGM